MDWRKLPRTELILIGEDVGIDRNKFMTYELIADAIIADGFEDEEIMEHWEDIQSGAEKRLRKEVENEEHLRKE